MWWAETAKDGITPVLIYQALLLSLLFFPFPKFDKYPVKYLSILHGISRVIISDQHDKTSKSETWNSTLNSLMQTQWKHNPMWLPGRCDNKQAQFQRHTTSVLTHRYQLRSESLRISEWVTVGGSQRKIKDKLNPLDSIRRWNSFCLIRSASHRSRTVIPKTSLRLQYLKETVEG